MRLSGIQNGNSLPSQPVSASSTIGAEISTARTQLAALQDALMPNSVLPTQLGESSAGISLLGVEISNLSTFIRAGNMELAKTAFDSLKRILEASDRSETEASSRMIVPSLFDPLLSQLGISLNSGNLANAQSACVFQ
jgi:hypothetical protein